MTNPKEALEWYERKRVEARAMADRDCKNCKHNKAGGCSRWDCEYEPVGSDLISRQDAIDVIKHSKLMTAGAMMDCKRRINKLPSAEPLVLTCDGCRHVGTYDTDFPCAGCIRREKDYYEQER